MFKKLLVYSILGITIVGQGLVPSSCSNPVQGRLLARRAAIVDVYRQVGGAQGVKIVKENFVGGVYFVKAEI